MHLLLKSPMITAVKKGFQSSELLWHFFCNFFQAPSIVSLLQLLMNMFQLICSIIGIEGQLNIIHCVIKSRVQHIPCRRLGGQI